MHKPVRTWFVDGRTDSGGAFMKPLFLQSCPRLRIPYCVLMSDWFECLCSTLCTCYL